MGPRVPTGRTGVLVCLAAFGHLVVTRPGQAACIVFIGVGWPVLAGSTSPRVPPAVRCAGMRVRVWVWLCDIVLHHVLGEDVPRSTCASTACLSADPIYQPQWRRLPSLLVDGPRDPFSTARHTTHTDDCTPPQSSARCPPGTPSPVHHCTADPFSVCAHFFGSMQELGGCARLCTQFPNLSGRRAAFQPSPLSALRVCDAFD